MMRNLHITKTKVWENEFDAGKEKCRKWDGMIAFVRLRAEELQTKMPVKIRSIKTLIHPWDP